MNERNIIVDLKTKSLDDELAACHSMIKLLSCRKILLKQQNGNAGDVKISKSDCTVRFNDRFHSLVTTPSVVVPASCKAWFEVRVTRSTSLYCCYVGWLTDCCVGIGGHRGVGLCKSCYAFGDP